MQNIRVIQSIQRAIDIINLFDDSQNFRLNLSQISNRLDLNINTTRGISSIAVPILLDNNKLYGTISITASTTIVDYIKLNSLDELLSDMKDCACKISNSVKGVCL